jgi:hypothetical protein
MEATIFTLVFLVITGALLLDVIPDGVIAPVDTFMGRTLLFLLPGALGGWMGVPEAIVGGTVAGLLLDRIHDSRTGSLASKKLGSSLPVKETPWKPEGGAGGKVIRDLSPNYVGAVSERLGLIPIMSPEERFTFGPSIVG